MRRYWNGSNNQKCLFPVNEISNEAQNYMIIQKYQKMNPVKISNFILT